MECNQCGREMMVINSEIVEEKTVQEFACVNPKCGMYSGRDLNNPLISIKETAIEE